MGEGPICVYMCMKHVCGMVMDLVGSVGVRRQYVCISSCTSMTTYVCTNEGVQKEVCP